MKPKPVTAGGYPTRYPTKRPLIPAIPLKLLLIAITFTVVAGAIFSFVANLPSTTTPPTTTAGPPAPQVPSVPSTPNSIPNYIPLKVGQYSITAPCKEEVPVANAKKILVCETPDMDLGNFPKEINIGDFVFYDFRETKTNEKILIVGIYKRRTATTVEGGYRGLNIERVALDEEKKQIRVGVGINITSREPGKNILTGQVGDIVISYYPSEVTINYPAKVIKYIRVRFIYIYI